MQNDAEAAALARSLTKQQRERLLTAPHSDWFTINWEGWKGLIWDLQNLGLTYPREPGLQLLSPLGLRVAQHLKQENSNG